MSQIIIRAKLSEEFAAAVKKLGADKHIEALTIQLQAACKKATVDFDADNAKLVVKGFATRQDAEEMLQELKEMRSIKSAYIPSKPSFF